MKNIFVVTHAQSLHHIEKKVGGWYDTGLTQQGYSDANAVADRLTTVIKNGPVEIFSSDLLRAWETADVIGGRLKRPIHSVSDLREISYGCAEGMPQAWLDVRRVPAPDDDRLDHRGGVEMGRHAGRLRSVSIGPLMLLCRDHAKRRLSLHMASH